MCLLLERSSLCTSPKDFRLLRKIADIIDAHGQTLLNLHMGTQGDVLPDGNIHIDTFWTDLYDDDDGRWNDTDNPGNAER